MKKPEAPMTQLQEVLFFLITRLKINRKQMILSCDVLNLPEQISKLRKRYNLRIDLSHIELENKFGRNTCYCEYSIENKKEALQLYRKIQIDFHDKEINRLSKSFSTS